MALKLEKVSLQKLAQLVNRFNKATLHPEHISQSFEQHVVPSHHKYPVETDLMDLKNEIHDLPKLYTNKQTISYQQQLYAAYEAVKNHFITFKKFIKEKAQSSSLKTPGFLGSSSKIRTSLATLDLEFEKSMQYGMDNFHPSAIEDNVRKVLEPLNQLEKQQLIREFKRKINLSDLLVSNYKLLGVDLEDAKLAKRLNVERKKLLEILLMEVNQRRFNP